MKIATLVLNILLGLVFTVFGLNGFFNFMPMPPMEGDPAVFAGIFASTGYLKVIKTLEVLCGVMILANFKRPLAYILLMPLVVGIVLFELLVAKQPGIGLVFLAILSFLIYQNRERYLPMVA